MSTSPRQLVLPVALSPEPTLDAYLPGPNAEAVAAVRALAEGGPESYIYLFGTGGRGKTHLLQGACLAATHQGRRAQYCPVTRSGPGPGVLEDLEGMDLVALDDLERIAGDAQWERAVFDLFNRLREHRRALLVAAAGGPDEIGITLPDLRSRLHWGPRYRLHGLSDEDCAALIAQIAHRRGLVLVPDMVRFILTHHARDPVSLVALLARVDNLSLREQRRITIPLIKRAMAGES